MIQTASQFIEAKGISEVARATGRTEGAVRVWKHRNRFPREAWLEINKAYPEMTLDVLRKIEPPRKSREARAA